MKNLFLDVETTGLPFKGAKWDKDFDEFPRIVSAAWYDDVDHYYIINQEGGKIPQSAIDVHGLTNDICDQALTKHFDLLPWLITAAENADRIIGYNTYFDTSVIKANVLRVFGEGSEEIKRAIAALDKSKRIDMIRGTLKAFKSGFMPMDEMYEMLFDEQHPQPHHALGDVHALKRIYEHCVANGYLIRNGERVC